MSRSLWSRREDDPSADSRPGQAGWGRSRAPQGWYTDPNGIYPERFWDGRNWTDVVRDPLWGMPGPEPVLGRSAVVRQVGDRLLIRWDRGRHLDLPLRSWVAGELSPVRRADGQGEALCLRLLLDPSGNQEPPAERAVEGIRITLLFDVKSLRDLENFLDRMRHWESHRRKADGLGGSAEPDRAPGPDPAGAVAGAAAGVGGVSAPAGQPAPHASGAVVQQDAHPVAPGPAANSSPSDTGPDLPAGDPRMRRLPDPDSAEVPRPAESGGAPVPIPAGSPGQAEAADAHPAGDAEYAPGPPASHVGSRAADAATAPGVYEESPAEAHRAGARSAGPGTPGVRTASPRTTPVLPRLQITRVPDDPVWLSFAPLAGTRELLAPEHMSTPDGSGSSGDISR